MEQDQHLQNLSELKNILSKNTRFLSFSGLSGVVAGVTALVGEFIFVSYLFNSLDLMAEYPRSGNNLKDAIVLFSIPFLVILISVLSGIILAKKKIKKQNITVDPALVRNTLIHILVPIIVGGLICIINLVSFPESGGSIFNIPAFMLIFYGLGLFNGSRFSFDDLKIVGLIFIGLGIITYAYPILSIWTWGLGFGVGHILYGLRVYFIHDRKAE